MRDAQKGRVIEALRQVVLEDERIFPRQEDAQQHVDDLAGQDWFQERFRSRKLEVVDTLDVDLPASNIRQREVAHVVAHQVTPSAFPDHGLEFCGNLLLLVEETIGEPAAQALREEFNARDIHFQVVDILEHRNEIRKRLRRMLKDVDEATIITTGGQRFRGRIEPPARAADRLTIQTSTGKNREVRVEKVAYVTPTPA